MPKNKPDLSIIILSYNTKGLLDKCLKSLEKVKSEVNFEIIVSDNGSNDGSEVLVKEKYKEVKLVENKNNLGYAVGNNRTREFCGGKYILFLNSDTEVYRGTLSKTLTYIKSHTKVGAITCKIVLPNGSLDRDARRSFPTPWVGFTHFSGLDRLFPKSKIFAKYWYGYLSEDKIHSVDVIQGAYFLSRKKVLDKVGWFDEEYFLDGEDIDLCWKIKESGWEIIYYPKASIKHVKKASKKKPTTMDREKFVMAGMESMKIFYKKHLWTLYPAIINYLVMFGISVIETLRKIKLKIS